MAVDNPSNLMPDQEIIIEDDAGFVPKASPSDAGKVLGVLNSSGDVGWVVDQSGTFIQVQADWAETDSSQPSYIDHKPDLSVYATASSVETALAGKQDTISDLSEIRSGASAGATAVQPATLESYATTSAMNTALASKQDVISDLSEIRSGAAAGATAAQPSDLPSSDELVPSASSVDSGKVLTVDSQGNPGWVTPSAGTVYTPGDGIDITNDVISADVDGVTIGIDASTKKIKSLQTIPTKTSDLQNDSNFVVASSLATVATSGSYADLTGKPTIPSVDQTYNASSTNAQSGTAVAQAIAAIPAPSVDEVPDVTSSDDGKVLTASYSGGQGSYSWETAGGSSTPDIFLATYGTTTFAEIRNAHNAGKAVFMYAPAVNVGDSGKLVALEHCFQANSAIDTYARFVQPFYNYGSYQAESRIQKNTVYEVNGNNVWSTNSAPAIAPPTAADAGKIYMAVAGGGGAMWVNQRTYGNMLSVTSNQVNVTTTAGITDIQVVNALPANPVATVLYLIPET